VNAAVVRIALQRLGTAAKKRPISSLPIIGALRCASFTRPRYGMMCSAT
jgi:hypothetical protein